MTLDQYMQYPIEIRRAWTQHRAGLNRDGSKQVCLDCGVEFPRMLPVFQLVATHHSKLHYGEIPDATPCTKRSYPGQR